MRSVERRSTSARTSLLLYSRVERALRQRDDVQALDDHLGFSGDYDSDFQIGNRLRHSEIETPNQPVDPISSNDATQVATTETPAPAVGDHLKLGSGAVRTPIAFAVYPDAIDAWCNLDVRSVKKHTVRAIGSNDAVGLDAAYSHQPPVARPKENGIPRRFSALIDER